MKNLWENVLEKELLNDYVFEQDKKIGVCSVDLFCEKLKLVLKILEPGEKFFYKENLEESGYKVITASKEEVCKEPRKIQNELLAHIEKNSLQQEEIEQNYNLLLLGSRLLL